MTANIETLISSYLTQESSLEQPSAQLISTTSLTANDATPQLSERDLADHAEESFISTIESFLLSPSFSFVDSRPSSSSFPMRVQLSENLTEDRIEHLPEHALQNIIINVNDFLLSSNSTFHSNSMFYVSIKY